LVCPRKKKLQIRREKLGGFGDGKLAVNFGGGETGWRWEKGSALLTTVTNSEEEERFKGVGVGGSDAPFR